MAEKTKKKTRERVLESACEVFAEKGYRDATIPEICERAGANVASVNYYFNSKENLYFEVWQRAYDQVMEHVAQEEECEDPKERLKKNLYFRVKGCFDKGRGGWFPRIVRHEMSDPTPMGEELRDRFLEPLRIRSCKNLRSMLGDDADELQVRCSQAFIHAMCIFFFHGPHPKMKVFGTDRPTNEMVDAVIEQMQVFALGGLRALKESGGEHA
jgi:AcrR family transcriptional regulator